ncbi:MAG: NUDIX hydrolase [Solobacterium sp.]|jgi:ADP-ribose pyrophosphatase YjhB (NUDIX family)|nr:NUDIX hydrolase [Solobacterium sp.]MBR3343662.1 NUDIX hydrolase [Solobacterium sp.]HAE16949.1 NUDIX hydrolase [Erysipelotrichaceae bacterium]
MEKVNAQGLTEKEFLEQYDDSAFRHPSNTVDMVLMTVSEGQLKLLLIRRGNHPWIHQWALPGGFVEFDEDLDDAVLRELKEETAIDEEFYFTQLYTFGSADRDPRTRVISTMYLALTDESNIRRSKAGDDAAETGWFTVKRTVVSQDDGHQTSVLTLDKDDVHIAYEITDKANRNYVKTTSRLLEESSEALAADHIKAVNMAVDLLRNRAASTGILFNLLPEEMTLRQIQDAYEAVVGHKTDTGNFRRDIKRMLVNTGRTRKSAGKQAALYRFNPMFRYLEENL